MSFLTDKAVCDFRLDFESFDIRAPTVTTEANNGHPCPDIFTAMVNVGYPSNVATVNTAQIFNQFPEICGNNQGQHCKLFFNT